MAVALNILEHLLMQQTASARWTAPYIMIVSARFHRPGIVQSDEQLEMLQDFAALVDKTIDDYGAVVEELAREPDDPPRMDCCKVSRRFELAFL